MRERGWAIGAGLHEMRVAFRCRRTSLRSLHNRIRRGTLIGNIGGCTIGWKKGCERDEYAYGLMLPAEIDDGLMKACRLPMGTEDDRKCLGRVAGSSESDLPG